MGLSASVLSAVFWPSALYGILKRRPIVWKLGWAVIFAGYLLFAVNAGWSILVVRKSPDNPYLEFAIAEAMGVLVCAYWCYHWYRYRDYFVQRAPSR